PAWARERVPDPGSRSSRQPPGPLVSLVVYPFVGLFRSQFPGLDQVGHVALALPKPAGNRGVFDAAQFVGCAVHGCQYTNSGDWRKGGQVDFSIFGRRAAAVALAWAPALPIA